MDTAVELLSGRTVPADKSYRTRAYRCPLCNGDVTPRSGTIRVDHFAHKKNAPQNCPLRANQPPQKFVEAMTRAVLHMRIVLVNGAPELIVLEEPPQPLPLPRRYSSPPPTRVPTRTPLGRRDPNDSTLPSLLGSIVFVRHLGGTFRGHDHRTQPVTWGDDLIVLAEHATVAPKAGGKNLPKVRLQGRQWLAWHVELPPTPTHNLSSWLAHVGITAETRSVRPRLVTPPHRYTDVPTYPAKTAISMAAGNKSARLSMSGPSQPRASGPTLMPDRIQSVTADRAMRVKVGSTPLEFGIDSRDRTHRTSLAGRRTPSARPPQKEQVMVNPQSPVLGRVGATVPGSAWVTPLFVHDDNAWTEAVAEKFHPDGTVFWHQPPHDVEKGAIVAFRIARGSDNMNGSSINSSTPIRSSRMGIPPTVSSSASGTPSRSASGFPTTPRRPTSPSRTASPSDR